MDFLHDIIIKLPDMDSSFNSTFCSTLTKFGEYEHNMFTFHKSHSEYKPDIRIRFEEINDPEVSFKTNDQEISISITNATGKEVKSNHTYKHITIDEYIKRIKNIDILGIDHVGFDLPWFDQGIHPDIEMLRRMLKKCSLYHLFPTGEPWDFIIPGTEGEITRKINTDYMHTRRPKFEIVSLDNVSIPLFQFDILVKESYSTLATIFPEAIHDPELKNMWIYIENPYNVDICFVVNEHYSGDWSDLFKDSRLA